MIAQVKTKRQKARFLNACRSKPVFGALGPTELALFNKSMPGRFYAGPTLALDIGAAGGAAWAAGSSNPDELAAFLALCGCRLVRMEPASPAPAGWRGAETLTVFTLAPGAALPEPAADEALLAGLSFNPSPSPGKIAGLLYPCDAAKRDDFYSALCTKLAHGAGYAWALERGGAPLCTVGVYARGGGQGYMACGCTAEPMRGRGIGGRLIVKMANHLAAQGERPVFLCRPERVHFYTRLGFEKYGELAQYAREE